MNRLLLLLAADADVTIPLGYVVSVIGTLAATLGALFWVREKERDVWFKRVESATVAIEQMNATVSALRDEVKRLNDEVVRLREALAANHKGATP